jgi:hypothetical protein
MYTRGMGEVVYARRAQAPIFEAAMAWIWPTFTLERVVKLMSSTATSARRSEAQLENSPYETLPLPFSSSCSQTRTAWSLDRPAPNK